MSDFNYLGLSFTPIRQLTEKENDFFKISKRISSAPFTPKDWNHGDFYEVAGIENSEIDLFECMGLIVIPGGNELFLYR